MKKILLLSVSMLSFIASFAQDVRISWEDDWSMPYNGEEVTIGGGDATLYTSFYIVNNNPERAFIWRRDILSMSNNEFEDQLCDDQICYTTSGNRWICPGPMTISQNDSSLFQPKLLTKGYAGTAHFRYFVLDENENKLDSVDVIFSSTATLLEESASSLEISVYPNPAKDFLLFKGEGLTKEAKGSIVDALGKTIKEFKVNKDTNKLNISSLNNGVYFVNLINEKGNRIKTMKLIVRK